MKQDTERTRRTQRKKKSKVFYYAYAVAILVLTIANLGIGLWLLTYVHKIEVKGNKVGEKREIISWIKEDPMTVNSIYTFLKFRGNSYELPIYMESVDVRLKAPWKLQVTVKEKQTIACVQEGRAYVYFDKEGLVLKKASKQEEGVLLIEGVEASNTGQFQYLITSGEKTFACIVSVTEELMARKIEPDRILWDEEGMNLYFEDIRIQLGKSKFDEKIPEALAMLEKLEGKKGIVHMEHYIKGGIIRFEENP